MQNLTNEGQQFVNDISARYNLSADAVLHMLSAVNNGAGSMAQFNCPELGGSGQWMRGGMTMVGDMFNNGLKMTVDNVCNELANGLASMQIFAPLPKGSLLSNQWWPSELGQPFSSGAQNNTRYAVFPNRLAVELNGNVIVYDTLNHNIGGVSQQQGGDNSLTFSSQFGTISVSNLPIISDYVEQSESVRPNANFAAPELSNSSKQYEPLADIVSSEPQNKTDSFSSADDAIAMIEKLAKLRDAGAITEQDFNSKKSELLNRI